MNDECPAMTCWYQAKSVCACFSTTRVLVNLSQLIYVDQFQPSCVPSPCVAMVTKLLDEPFLLRHGWSGPICSWGMRPSACGRGPCGVLNFQTARQPAC